MGTDRHMHTRRRTRAEGGRGGGRRGEGPSGIHPGGAPESERERERRCGEECWSESEGGKPERTWGGCVERRATSQQFSVHVKCRQKKKNREQKKEPRRWDSRAQCRARADGTHVLACVCVGGRGRGREDVGFVLPHQQPASFLISRFFFSRPSSSLPVFF